MKLPKHITRIVLAVASAATAVTAFTPAMAQAGTIKTTPRQRMKAAKVARSEVGRPYSWGAMGPSAFDCSGLVSYAYAKARHALGARTSYEMWRLGRHVHRSGLKRGDIVFTWDPGKGHVGIYLGNGRYVHAPGTGRHVQVAPLPWNGYYGAVRP